MTAMGLFPNMLAEEKKTAVTSAARCGGTNKRGSNHQAESTLLVLDVCIQGSIVQYNCTRTGRSSKRKKSEADPARKGKTAVCFLN